MPSILGHAGSRKAHESDRRANRDVRRDRASGRAMSVEVSILLQVGHERAVNARRQSWRSAPDPLVAYWAGTAATDEHGFNTD